MGNACELNSWFDDNENKQSSISKNRNRIPYNCCHHRCHQSRHTVVTILFTLVTLLSHCCRHSLHTCHHVFTLVFMIFTLVIMSSLLSSWSSLLSSWSSRPSKNRAREKLKNRQRWKQNSSPTGHNWFTKTVSPPLFSLHTLAHLRIVLCLTISEGAGIYLKPHKRPSSTQDSRMSERQILEASCMANSAPTALWEKKELTTGQVSVKDRACDNVPRRLVESRWPGLDQG